VPVPLNFCDWYRCDRWLIYARFRDLYRCVGPINAPAARAAQKLFAENLIEVRKFLEHHDQSARIKQAARK
jgi:hypothetical protein